MTNDKQVHVAIDLLLGSLVSDRGFPDANIEDVITIPIYKDKDDFHLEQPFTTIGELNSLRRIRRAHIESSNIIEKVKIKNIKTLQDVEVDLSLLSIIAGINSAGKSSLIESIAVLPRYLDQDFDEMSIPLGDDKFNLGNFRNILSYDTPEDEGASIKLTYLLNYLLLLEIQNHDMNAYERDYYFLPLLPHYPYPSQHEHHHSSSHY